LFGLSGIIDGAARYLDKTIGGRWWSVDPLAEISRRFSPYTYANANPLIFTDPDGMKTVYRNGGYYDDQTNESKSWYEVQNELGITDSGGGSGGSLVYYAPPKTPIFVVDPKVPDMENTKNVTFIEEPASTGGETLKKMLIEKYL
jgi:hypothetical protein